MILKLKPKGLTMKKFITTMMLALHFFVFSTVTIQQAYAGISPSEAFSSLLDGTSSSRSDPGKFSTSARDVYSLGSYSMHFPTKVVSLASFTPPTLSAGCNGISAHFGGFSFISLEEIAKLIRAIGQGAIGFIIQLALKAICPQCEAVLEFMQKLSQFAAGLAINSCQAGEALAKALWDKGFGDSSKYSSTALMSPKAPKAPDKAAHEKECSSVLEEMGSVLDAAQGREACKTTGKMMTTLAGAAKSANDTFTHLSDKYLRNANKDGGPVYGNLTWIGLQAAGFADPTEMEFLQSLIGVTLMTEQNKITVYNGGQAAPTYQAMNLPPFTDNMPPIYTKLEHRNSNEKIMFAMLCGIEPNVDIDQNPILTGTNIAEFCLSNQKRLYPTSQESVSSNFGDDFNILACDDDPTVVDKYAGCTSIKSIPYKTWVSENPNAYKVDQGIAISAAIIMLKQIKNTSNGIVDSANFNRFVQLSNRVAFLPLYKINNIAAVYPAAAKDLVSNYSHIIGLEAVDSLINNIINGMSQNKAAVAQFNQDNIKPVLNLKEDVAKYMKVQRNNVSELFTMQEALIANIRTIDQKVQQQVVSKNILRNAAFSQGMMNSMSRGR